MTESSTFDLDALCRRAVAEPASITRAELNLIAGWPEPSEEDRLCVQKTGLARADLVAKALDWPQSLNLDECQILAFPEGVLHSFNPNDLWGERFQRSKLQHEALGALAGRDDAGQKAFWNAAKRMGDIFSESHRASKAFEKFRRLKEFRSHAKEPWIEKIVEDGLPGGCWGFVCFRTDYDDENAWKRFQQYWNAVCRTVLGNWVSGYKLSPSYHTAFVEDEATLNGASAEVLRAHFCAMRAAGQVPNGIRLDCFIVADATSVTAVSQEMLVDPPDDKAFCTYLAMMTHGVFVRAVDPDYRDLGSGTTSHETVKAIGVSSKDGSSITDLKDVPAGPFGGEVTLALLKVFDWLHWACYAGLGWDKIRFATRRPGLVQACPISSVVPFYSRYDHGDAPGYRVNLITLPDGRPHIQMEEYDPFSSAPRAIN